MIVDFINLDRFAERRQEFMSNNAHLSEVRRCGLFDGRGLDPAALAAAGVIDREVMKTYTAGALGVALAHIHLWDGPIRTGQPATICEDDAIFHRDFERRAEAMIARLPEDWDVFLYGWNFDAMLLLDMLPGISPALVFCDEDRLRAHAGEFQRHSQPSQPFRVLQCFGGALAYTISPKGAAILKAFCLPIRPLAVTMPGPSRNLRSDRLLANIGIDVMMAAAYPQLNAFIAFPPLAASKNDHGISTIRHQPRLAGA
jgi:glycosyl transferase, family 25